MVSPYLLRPVRSLEDVIEASRARAVTLEAHRRSLQQGRASEGAAAALRKLGRLARPRVVWVNRNKAPGDKN